MEVLQKRQTLRYLVGSDVAGSRLDQFIAGGPDEISRGTTKKLIDIGAVHVNGRRIRKCSLILNAADRVEVNIDGLPLSPFELSDAVIVFQDRHLIVLNKPAGVDCQPTPSRYKGTLYAALGDYLQNPQRRDLRPTIGMVQRLDRDTSGLIVFSIHQAAHRQLTHSFQQRQVHKTYLALVGGRMEQERGEIRSLLARRRATNLMKSVERGGQEAITRFRTLEATDEVSYVEIDIPTGRSHQIRAHFAEAGHPLLGDSRYGGVTEIGGACLSRQMLHAARLQFKHPVNGETLDFMAELPYDMQTVVTRFFPEYA